MDPSEVPIYMRAMGVVVHTSIREGVARVIPQVYAVGVPVVALNLGRAPEVIEHGRTGFLIEPGSEASVTEARSTLLRSSQLRHQMALQGCQIVLKKFPAEVRVEHIDEVYVKLLAHKGLVTAATPRAMERAVL